MITEKTANTAIRIGIAGVFLWFGVSQLLSPSDWTNWVPMWMDAVPIPTETLVIMHGLFEVVFGFALLIGFQTRIAAGMLAASLLFTVFNLNYGETMIRDLGLLIVTGALVFQKDAYTYRDVIR
ncbi:MAG: DoxX family protein [Candidatus Woesearchaeota archaeon]